MPIFFFVFQNYALTYDEKLKEISIKLMTDFNKNLISPLIYKKMCKNSKILSIKKKEKKNRETEVHKRIGK